MMLNEHTKEQLFPEGVAVVIGGSGGMGSMICEYLIKAGTDVVFTYYKNKARADELIESLSGNEASIKAVQLANQNYEQVESVFNQIAQQQNIHTLVVASGFDIPQEYIADLTPQQWRDVIDSDTNGFFNLVHAALPHLRKSGESAIVHLSSAGLLRYPQRDILSVAPKACNEQLIKGIAKEEGRHGIRANSIAVGVIETGIFLRLWEQGVFDEKWKEEVHKGLCLKRWGKPEGIAEAVLYLASRRSSYVTGQLLALDGGYGV